MSPKSKYKWNFAMYWRYCYMDVKSSQHGVIRHAWKCGIRWYYLVSIIECTGFLCLDIMNDHWKLQWRWYLDYIKRIFTNAFSYLQTSNLFFCLILLANTPCISQRVIFQRKNVTKLNSFAEILKIQAVYLIWVYWGRPPDFTYLPNLRITANTGHIIYSSIIVIFV